MSESSWVTACSRPVIRPGLKRHGAELTSTPAIASPGRLARMASSFGNPWRLLAVSGALLGLAAHEDGRAGLLAGLGFAGAFLSGLLGVGGAIVLIPLVLYVPPVAGFATLDIKTVAGITVIQVTAAAVAGLFAHRQAVDRRLLITLGPTMLAASFAGAVASKALPASALEAVFAGVATLAAVVLVAFRGRVAADALAFPDVRLSGAVIIAISVGLVGGLLGAGGAFLLIPLLLHGLHVPMRIAVGTSLAVVAMSAAAALVGKALTGQIDWVLATALVAGALPGARLGSVLSRNTPSDRLTMLLALVIAIVAVRMWIALATGMP
jgi:uncharacterized membrane protein YfcA